MNEGRDRVSLYDAIGQLDAPRRAFVLGLWIPDARRARTIGSRRGHRRHRRVSRVAHPHDAVQSRLVRPGDDPGADRGRRRRRPARSSSRGFWTRLFSSVDLAGRCRAADAGIDEEPIDAAWLAETIGSPTCASAWSGWSRSPLDSGSFGDGRRPRSRGRFVALRALSRYRMLILDARSHRRPDPVALRGGGASRGAAFGDRRPPRLCRAGAVQGASRSSGEWPECAR